MNRSSKRFGVEVAVVAVSLGLFLLLPSGSYANPTHTHGARDYSTALTASNPSCQNCVVFVSPVAPPDLYAVADYRIAGTFQSGFLVGLTMNITMRHGSSLNEGSGSFKDYIFSDNDFVRSDDGSSYKDYSTGFTFPNGHVDSVTAHAWASRNGADDYTYHFFTDLVHVANDPSSVPELPQGTMGVLSLFLIGAFLMVRAKFPALLARTRITRK